MEKLQRILKLVNESRFRTIGAVVALIVVSVNCNDDGRTTSETPNVNDLHTRVDPNRLREFHLELTREPHMAGQRRDQELVQYIKTQMEAFGVPQVQLDGYECLLSYPNASDPNLIRLIRPDSSVEHVTSYRETPIIPGDDHPEFVHAFLAYTPAGNVVSQAAPVYVNYGRIEDHQQLEALNVSVAGKICIARYGRIFRGNKVRLCEERGAVGVIIFSDPADVAPLGQAPEDVYPNTKFLPGTGIQRGGTKILTTGDPLSVGWPSVEGAYRLPLDQRRGLPNIPAQPIGYTDAQVIMNTLGGPEVPLEWIGGLQGITYRLGGEFNSNFAGYSISLESHNVFDDTTTNDNVIGIIPGWEEPDRYIVISNHRDAWGFGSVDPSSGSAVMLEMARVLGDMVVNDNWLPRRTIVFASWGAEEFGLLGSAEWVFDKMDKLRDRGVVVINVDSPVQGPVLRTRASPSLLDLQVELTKTLPYLADTTNEEKSYYDYWSETIGEAPSSYVMGSGSDHDAFVFTVGVSAIDYSFRQLEYGNPAYHTGYETFYLIDSIYDPGFKISALATQMAISTALKFADELILPFKHKGLVDFMRDKISEWEADGTANRLATNGASLDPLIGAIYTFEEAITDFETRVNETCPKDRIAARRHNDQMMKVERVFIAEQGLPNRDDSRNVIYSPSKYNRYVASSFPGLSDLLFELDTLTDPAAIALKWEEIRRHVSDLFIAVRQAASYLRPFEVI